MGVNDKPAATWHPGSGACPTCSGPTRHTVNMVCQTCGTDYGAGTDDIEPVSLPELAELVRETAETLDTLLDHAHALKHEVDSEVTANGADLAFVADRLRAAWAACRVAQTAAQELAAVQP